MATRLIHTSMVHREDGVEFSVQTSSSHAGHAVHEDSCRNVQLDAVALAESVQMSVPRMPQSLKTIEHIGIT